MNILFLVLGVVVLFIVVRLMAKTALKAFLVVALLVTAGFFLFVWQGGIITQEKAGFSYEKLEAGFCEENADPIICSCIVQPVMEEMQRRYTQQELEAFEENPVEAYRVFASVMTAQRKEIRACLKSQDALVKWREFRQDLREMEFQSAKE